HTRARRWAPAYMPRGSCAQAPAAVAVRYRQPLGPQVEFVSPKVLLAQVKRLFGGKLQQEYRVDAGVRFIF
ncbi:hypothetical protein, partial [uncultured Parasutterella sp.]|uniref:hypothetical protein n=1 Tax=uncultured Parasutterella sp. TaxID=1263098 RepID=UPI002729D740